MRKNKAMRAAGVLFIATMLTTCLTAGTLAKYTTGDSAGDNARVAKFGVQIVANGSLFGDSYKAADANTPVFKASGDGITVDAFDDTNVVAPGTKNENGLGFAVTGKPEVDVKLDLEIKTENVFLAKGEYGVMVAKPANAVTADNFANLKAEVLYTEEGGVYTVVGENTAFDKNATYYVLKNKATVPDGGYYPVVYTLTGNDATSTENTDTTADSAKAVAEKIAKQFDADAAATVDNENAGKYTLTTSKIVKANTDLALDALNLDNEKITWAWEYEKKTTDAETSETVVDENVDNMDTILGDLADDTVKANVVKLGNTITAPTAGKDYNLKTGIEFTINATQVD